MTKLNKIPVCLFILISLFIMSCGGGGGGGGSSSKTLISIEITPASLTIAPNTTGQFRATGTYSDNSTKDITTSVTWSSSDTAVATIDSSSGLAAALSPGTATITALSGSVSGTATMTVSALVSIVISPASPTVALGATQPFIATGILSDGTNQTLTNAVSWSSSSESVATISNTTGSRGVAISLAAGNTTITAGLSGISDSTLMTVTAMDNVMKVSVNGSLCSAGSYVNKPCVSVTVCEPGTSDCRTIDDILLDTGSIGLRIFKSVLADLTLAQVTSGAGSLASCIQYVDGSANWGPVQIADIILGNEKASNVPVQVIDAAFGSVPSSCGTPDESPAQAGYNGILGVGLFTEDCGSACVSSSNIEFYYSCSGSSCTTTAVPLSDQVQNPVARLPVDNNGFIIRLPAVPPGGTVSAEGILVLGIGTKANNTPSGITAAFATDADGEFTTVFNGITYSDSFIDSGSNGLFFNRSLVSALIICSDWYCPSSTQSLSATIEDHAVSFNIGNATTLFASVNNVFSELGGTYESFDWGLPFFLGRSVYVVIDGKTSGLGTGPYLAY